MARTRVTRRTPEWVIGLAITLVVLVTAWIRPAFLDGIEYRLFDLRLRWLGARPPAQNIAIVAIDEESITNLVSAADQAQAGAARPAAPGEMATQRFTTRPDPAEE